MEELQKQEKGRKQIVVNQGSGAGAVYGIGIFGAWAYYLGDAETAQDRVRALVKGLFWPAFVVHDLMAFLEREAPDEDPS